MEDNLIGRYLKTLIDSPQYMRAKEGDILKIIDSRTCVNITTNEPNKWGFDLNTNYYELLPIGFNPCSESKVESWKPKVGDYAIMERAGGWGYHPDNNGCLAIIDNVGERAVGPDLIRTCIAGRVLNPKYNIGKHPYVEFNNIPITDRDGDIICRKALPHEINVAAIVESEPKLNHFPQEGCVYESPENMKDFVNYLLNRPGNRADGKIDRSEAIGIGWNHNSCWWLKTKSSGKTLYKLENIQHLYPSLKHPTEPLNTKSEDIVLNDSLLGSIISCKWGGKRYNECLFIKEGDYYYLLNNVTNNNDGHKDKSKYKYSLIFYGLETLNTNVKDIRFLSISSEHIDMGNYIAVQCDSDTKDTRAEMFKKYPYPASHNPCGEISLSSNNGMVDLYIPEIKEIPIKVDYSVNIKLTDIKLPDYNVIPEKIQPIKIETYNIYL